MKLSLNKFLYCFEINKMVVFIHYILWILLMLLFKQTKRDKDNVNKVRKIFLKTKCMFLEKYQRHLFLYIFFLLFLQQTKFDRRFAAPLSFVFMGTFFLYYFFTKSIKKLSTLWESNNRSFAYSFISTFEHHFYIFYFLFLFFKRKIQLQSIFQTTISNKNTLKIYK